ncbi:unnamed protein product [Cylindrotheca closterium]|uniref:Leucine-rich repeat-containing N-terminal plant-type domain-containing protein n=1 Tax=Cylindrotheca closterium TaxID=2856 RepID=A0AAD2FN60_9STRA|nr:unnamed protein product [Cylindrotheca closterium]
MSTTDVSNNNNAETQPTTLIEAEVALDIEQIVQGEVQRAVQEVIETQHQQPLQERPLAIVLSSESNGLNSEDGNNGRPPGESDGKICGLSRIAFFIVLFAAVVTAIAVGIAAPSFVGDEASLPVVTVAPNMSRTMAPSNASTTLLLNLLYPSKTVEDLSPAQFNATLWVVDEDSFEWNEPNELLERHALATFYFATGNTNTTPEWLASDISHCEWEFVSCNENGSVLSLQLEFKGLQGSLPAEIGRLSSLEELLLPGNRLNGQLPTELYSLTMLTWLNIGGNMLSGSLDNIGQLTRLRGLLCDGNRFQSIPNEMAKLQFLEVLKFIGSGLNSTIPANLPSSLTSLNLANNKLQGSIPFLSALSNLQDLTLSYNNLSGQIPPTGEMTALTWMLLTDNRLDGSLNSEFGNMVRLEYFNAANNLLNASIPSEVFGISTLTSLRLENNLLSGPLPTDMSTLRRLRFLYLNKNRLSGPIPESIGNSMVGLSSLELGYNQFTSTLPSELSKLNLRMFDVRENLLTGSVPASFNRWSLIRAAYFYSNNFTGGLENLFCDGRNSARIVEADCELTCTCCTGCK